MHKLWLLLALLPFAGCSEPAPSMDCGAAPDGYSRAIEVQVQYPQNPPETWPELDTGRVTMYEGDTALKVGYLDGKGCTWLNAQPGTYWMYAEIPKDGCNLAAGVEVTYEGVAMSANVTGLGLVCQ